jgi:hypothetical protein
MIVMGLVFTTERTGPGPVLAGQGAVGDGRHEQV